MTTMNEIVLAYVSHSGPTVVVYGSSTASLAQYFVVVQQPH